MDLHKLYEELTTKQAELTDLISCPTQLSREKFISYAKEHSELTILIDKLSTYVALTKELAELDDLINSQDIEEEILYIAREEQKVLQQKILEITQEVKIILRPKDKNDSRDVILEIRAGVGGEEAGLFVTTLFKMYQQYAEKRKWRFEVLNTTPTGIGGYKEIILNISGKNVFSRLKFESGVHRVQRVPETEASGRLHTSAVTVAILPEPEDIEVNIIEKDLRIDVYRSSGPGGQSVNTTNSAIRITHVPSGIVVIQQDEKSQHKNKAKAMKVLRARLYELERQEKESTLTDMRKKQIGSGDRSERIRTYNFPQGRVSDHRINLTLYKINAITEEGDLDELIDALILDHEKQDTDNTI